MRSFTTLIAGAGLLAASAMAAPDAAVWGSNWGPWTQNVQATQTPCMSDVDAQTVANNFQTLIASYSNATAEATLTSDFHDYTDSVIELIDNGCPNSPVPLGVATFASRVAFEAGQGSQPPIPFQQLNVWHNCNTVFLRWISKQTPAQVTGIIVLETQYQNNTWLIQTVFSEFNSGAWLVNLGIFKPENCSSSH